MKHIKLIVLFLSLFISASVSAQWQQTGNTLQRAADGSGYKYRFNLGAPGYFAISDTLLKFSKKSNFINIKDLGGVGNGSYDNTAIINQAIADNKEIYFPQGDYIVNSLFNDYGKILKGPGRIMKPLMPPNLPLSTGAQQLNIGLDNSELSFGSEYLQFFRQKMSTGQNVIVNLLGNSTYAGDGVTSDFKADALLKFQSTQNGINKIQFVNKGRSGGTLHDFKRLYLETDIANNPDLIIIGYTINRGSTDGTLVTIDQFKNDIDGLLSTLRATKNQTQLSIILKIDNSTNDTENGRDEAWNEQVSNVYRSMARKYQCGFIDTYKQLIDSRNGAAGFTYDNPFGDGRAIHPNNGTNILIWSQVYDFIFPSVFIKSLSASKLVNQGYADRQASYLDNPSFYFQGININRTPNFLGWPIDGMATTFTNSDLLSTQFISSYSLGSPKLFLRTGNLSPGVDTWTGAVEVMTKTTQDSAINTLNLQNVTTKGASSTNKISVNKNGDVIDFTGTGLDGSLQMNAYSTGSGGMRFIQRGNNDLSLWTNSAERLTVKNTGSVVLSSLVGSGARNVIASPDGTIGTTTDVYLKAADVASGQTIGANTTGSAALWNGETFASPTAKNVGDVISWNGTSWYNKTISATAPIVWNNTTSVISLNPSFISSPNSDIEVSNISGLYSLRANTSTVGGANLIVKRDGSGTINSTTSTSAPGANLISNSGPGVLAISTSGIAVSAVSDSGKAGRFETSTGTGVAVEIVNNGTGDLISGSNTAGKKFGVSNIGGVTGAGDFEITDFSKGVILRASDNSRWRITVSTTGVLSTTLIP